jgi:proteasome lid subunit RPN8/RPN11
VHLQADRDAEDRGAELVGVVHSHTHSEPYPSPTDVAQAPDPAWLYVIVSFRLGQPMLRSYRILEGEIIEEPVLVLEQ